MPQSLSRILIHLVFITKDRIRVLTSTIKAELHPYLAGTLAHIDCPSLLVACDEQYVWVNPDRGPGGPLGSHTFKPSLLDWARNHGPLAR